MNTQVSIFIKIFLVMKPLISLHIVYYECFCVLATELHIQPAKPYTFTEYNGISLT